MRAVGVEEAAAVGAELLDDLLRGHRSLRDRLRGDRIHHRLAAGVNRRLAIGADVLDLLRLHQLYRVVGPQVLHHALRDQHQRAHNAERQQHPQAGADQVHPEIADGLHLAAGNAANEGNRQRDADRRRREVVVGEPGHLRQIAHGGFAGIVLPVGVGGERRRRVERQRLRDRRKLLRIQRQKSLYPLHQVQQQHRHHAEQQHGEGVLRPAHLVIFIDAGQAIEQALDRPQHRVHERPLAVEHPGHEDAHGLGDQENQREKNRDLQPSIDTSCQNFSGRSSA